MPPELRDLAMGMVTLFAALSACVLTVMAVEWFNSRRKR